MTPARRTRLHPVHAPAHHLRARTRRRPVPPRRAQPVAAPAPGVPTGPAAAPTTVWLRTEDVPRLAEDAVACPQDRLTTAQIHAGASLRLALVWQRVL